MDLTNLHHWLFDLDGTLTVPMHDFTAIRTMLGLPHDIGILEALAALPPERSAPLERRLDDYEYELAAHAEPADGAAELLEALCGLRVRLGIASRNSLRNVQLLAVGFEGDFFNVVFFTKFQRFISFV